ncbi:MAG: bacitracin resistance protein BacA [Lachnospiraceae bacterium]|nr:bacitracin resistance protein BacA [Lachnospiraceae bacterium]
MLDQKTIDLVKSTVPAIKENGLTITKTFYKNMFERSPEIVPFFNMDNQASGKQPKALAMTILAAAENIDNLEKLAPAVDKVAKVHCNCKVVPEQYPIIGKHLLEAIKEVLQDAVTDEIIEAWGKAYAVIADIFIEAEKQEYAARTNA